MGRAGKGPGGEGRQSAVTECRAALPAPLPGVWERSRARGRGPGAWGRGSAGFWTSRAARGARWPPELGAEPGARSPEPGAGRYPLPVRWAAAPAAAARLPGSAPRHGAFAQRRRDGGCSGGSGGGGPGGVLVQRGGGAGPREEGPPARRHPLHALSCGRHLSLPQHFCAGTG